MIVNKAYRFRIEANCTQREQLERYAGCTRFVWNWFLEQRKQHYAASGKGASWLDQDAQLKHLKAFYPFLSDCPSQSLQQTLRDLDKAFQSFFKGAGYPRFKKKGEHDSMRFPQGFSLCGDHLRLPKIGEVKLRLSRKVHGTIKNVTVSRRGKHWFASLCCEVVEHLAPSTGPAVGIDLGVANVVSLSTGERVKPCSFTKLERAKRKQQRILARRRKGSANWKKAKAKLGRVHERIGDKRNDFLHKLSTAISKNHAQVVVENLQVGNMTKSAKGTPEDPGVNVKAKAGLNRSILEQGWGEFVRQLDYKTQWRGGALVKVDPRHTSQRCSCCGHTASENRLSQSVFHCVQCGHSEHADTNAAKNILACATSSGLLAVGLTVTACESNRIGGRKQERAKRKLPVQGERISHAA